MCRSLLSITAWHLSLHERINILHLSTDIFSHYSFKLVHSSLAILRFFSLGLSFNNFQTFLIGFMSWLWAGHSITSNEPSPVTTEQVKLWLIAEMNTIPLFFIPYEVFRGKFQSNHFVLFRNLRLYRSYSTVLIYFIKSSGNSVPWYFNAKVSISSFTDSGCCRKSMLFWFVINLSVFICCTFPMPARCFLGFTWPSFLKFSLNTMNNTFRFPHSLWNIPDRKFVYQFSKF